MNELFKNTSCTFCESSRESHELLILRSLIEDILDILAHLEVIDHLVTLIKNKKAKLL